jgi:hypothetical protein
MAAVAMNAATAAMLPEVRTVPANAVLLGSVDVAGAHGETNYAVWVVGDHCVRLSSYAPGKGPNPH